jgi:hypothetical protein
VKNKRTPKTKTLTGGGKETQNHKSADNRVPRVFVFGQLWDSQHAVPQVAEHQPHGKRATARKDWLLVILTVWRNNNNKRQHTCLPS